MEKLHTCEACGLPIKKDKEKINPLLCSVCTQNYTKKPSFNEITFSLAIGYFLNILKIDDFRVAFNGAKAIVLNYPYWKKFSDSALISQKGDYIDLISDLIAEFQKSSQNINLTINRDLFLSYAWKDKKNFDIDVFVKRLENRGFTVWFDNYEFGKEAGKTVEWMKKGIDGSRMAIPILSKAYFESENCLFEINRILNSKNAKQIFPIWLSDIDANYLRKQKYGKDLVDIIGVIINDSESLNVLVNKISLMIFKSKGYLVIDGIHLTKKEADFINSMKELGINVDMFEENSLYLSNVNKKVGGPTPFLQKPTSICSILSKGGHIIKISISFLPSIEIPKEIGFSIFLEELEITNCLNSNLPTNLFNFPYLKRLILKGNMTSDLPDIIYNLSNLEYLDLSGNQLKELPNMINNLSNLKYLDISNNNITRLPKALFKLKSLEILKCDYNPLQDLPENFGDLKELKIFQAKESSLIEIPESIGKCRNLKILDLSDNSTRRGYKNSDKGFGNNFIGSKQYIRSLPNSIIRLTNLEELNIRGNQIKDLPKGFRNLESLKRIFLNYNKFNKFPEELHFLPNIEIIDISENNIEEFPQSIISRSSLKLLNLTLNPLRSIPEYIDQLRDKGFNIVVDR